MATFDSVHDAADHTGLTGVGGASLVDFAKSRRTSGDITISSTQTTWQNLDTGLDLVVDAEAGDIIQVSVSLRTSSAAVFKSFDVCTVVAGSPVNYFGSGEVTSTSGNGITGLTCISGAIDFQAATAYYIVQAGDISGGQVTLRLRTRGSGLTNYAINSTTTDPLDFAAVVWRP